jgi:hypothetical protein
LRILEEKEAARVERQQELNTYNDQDPRVLESEGIPSFQQLLNVLAVRSLNLYKEGSVRLIENISNLQTYFVREMGVSQSDIEMQLGITEEIMDETF